MHNIDATLLYRVTREVLSEIDRPEPQLRRDGARRDEQFEAGSRPIDRFVIMALNRRSCGARFEEVRRRQVERLGNRPTFERLRSCIPALQGCVTVATCCRFEIHGLIHESFLENDASLVAGFLQTLGFDSDDADLVEVYRGGDALRHLLWTAVGGASILPGETEIVSQLRQAYDQSIDDGKLAHASMLHRIYQRTFQVTRRLRLLHFGGGGISKSLSRIALNRLKDGWNLKSSHAIATERRVGIVGAGAVATGLAEALQRDGVAPENLIFYVRNEARARGRENFPQAAQTRPIEQILDDLAAGELDGLMGAVTHPIAALEDQEKWKEVREETTIVDLSVPAMIKDEVVHRLPIWIRYVDFETMMDERRKNDMYVRGCLEAARRDIKEQAERLASDIDRRETLRGLQLQKVRAQLRRRIRKNLAGDIDAIVWRVLGEKDSIKSPHRPLEQRIARLRRDLAGLIEHQALEALKAHYLELAGIS